MNLIIVSAMDPNGVIGKGGVLPWYYPDELKWFRFLTIGGTVVMGNETYKSLGCSPLPNRRNIILSKSTPSGISGGVLFLNSLETLLESGISDKYYIIGGRSVYKQAYPLASEMIITKIKKEYDGDCYFPKEVEQILEPSKTLFENDRFCVERWLRKF